MARRKKNKKRLFRILAVSGILYYLLLRGSKALIVGLRSYAIDSFDFGNGKIYIRLNFEVKNPLKIGVTVRGIKGDVYINGMIAGWVSNTSNLYLQSGNTSVIPVVAELSIKGLTDAVLHSLESGNQENTIAFNGNVYTGLATIPVQVETTDGAL